MLGGTHTRGWARSAGRTCRWVRAVVALAAVSIGMPALVGTVQRAGAAPAAFNPALVNDEFVVGGMVQALAGDWLPDGRMLVLTKPGLIYVVNTATATKSLLYTMPDVDSRGESGALDIVIDLSFATNRTVYLYYSAQSDFRLRIARLVLDVGLANVVSNTTLWSNPGPLRTVYADPTNHIGGSLDIGPDGKFYLSIGDALAGLSQDLTNVFGKILRINFDGSIPADNPAIPGKTINEIWAYGVRNPYRSQYERGRTPAKPQGMPATPYWMGDVGGNVAETAYEEVNIAEAGKNYGWPLCEGPVGQPKNGLVCPSGVTGPVLSYPHTAGVACCFNKAIIGGQMYRSGNFPLAGYYIYGDYPSSTISWMQLDATGRVSNDTGLVHKLQTNNLDEAPVWIDISPDGNIYFLDIFTGNLRRLTYSGGTTNQPPVITSSSATPTTGPAPLTVNFTGAATDPEGDPISYLWIFGDGSTSTVPSPSHVYAAGSFQARLQVTAAGQTVNADPIAIAAGGAPTVAITSPANGFVFSAGQRITATGTASDAIDGALPGTSMSWTVLVRHDNHTHPVVSSSPGASVAFDIPTTGHDFSGVTGYRISLTATNSTGVSTTRFIDINPTKILVPVSANIATSAVLSGIRQALPFNIDTIPGFQHSVEVPASVCVNGVTQNFATWSDGGARVHTITAAAGQRLVATYAAGASCSTIGTLRVSQAPERSPAVDLAGTAQPASGNVYIFLDTTTTNFQRVEFYLDDPTFAQAPIHGESVYPYDYVGGGVPTAFPQALAALSAGSHTVSVLARRVDGTAGSTSATFTVGTVTVDVTPPTLVSTTPASNATGVTTSVAPVAMFSEAISPTSLSGITLATAAGAAVPTAVTVSGSAVTITPTATLTANTQYRITIPSTLKDLAGNSLGTAATSFFTTAAVATGPGEGVVAWSTVNTRANAVALQGQSFTTPATAYIFLNTNVTSFVHVEFWLDNAAATGPATHTESMWPYDFVGGSVPTAFPYSFTGLARGTHTITVKSSPPTGAPVVVSVTFTVA